MPGTMLVVDDENLIRWAIKKEFEKRGFYVRTAHNAATGLRLFVESEPDITLLDVKLPDKSGLDVLREMKRIRGDAIVILITSFGGVESAVTAIKDGAYDYIEKPFQFERMDATIQRALEKIQLKNDIQGLTTREKGAHCFDQIAVTAQSDAMRKVLGLARRVAATDSTTVLIQGESGTGKDFLAKIIHYESARVLKPYVDISCAALPDTLMESELFGFEKGAFTDAKQAKKGLFEIANGGTVYVDEIGDVTPSTQVKLLRVLEEKKFKHIGGNRDISIDVRIIAATNRSLEKEVEKGTFRQDLYYRLKVLPIYLPPLRERREDIIPLADHFIGNANRKLKKEVGAISPEAKGILLQYRWPGNVRELKNTIEHIMILHDTGTIDVEHLPAELVRSALKPTEAEKRFPEGPGGRITVPDSGIDLAELERELIRQALAATGGNKTRAARLLNLTRDTLRYRIQKLDL